MKITATDALELSVPERIQLVTEIWDSIAECPEQIELTDATAASPKTVGCLSGESRRWVAVGRR